MDYITHNRVLQGRPISKQDRVKLMSADDFEEFIKEWLETRKDKYFDIERLGGAGDQGRDVIAYLNDPQKNPENYEWECYQCKHYKNPLSPSNVWKEFGKIIYFSFLGEYPVPKSYYLVGSNDIGTSLSDLLRKPQKLKEELIKNWDNHCKDKITDKKEVTLTDDLKNYINNFDFTIFKKLKIQTVINEHQKHKNHLITFGGNLPDRKSLDVPDIKLDEHLPYINQLIKAYDSDSNQSIKNISALPKKYQRHFNDARKAFYKAEELRLLTRDNLPDRVFKDLKDNIYDGIINTAEDDFDNGFKRVKSVENVSTSLVIQSNPLNDVCGVIDKKGLCHHLVNDKRISWVYDD